VPKHKDFGFQRSARPEQSDQGAPDYASISTKLVVVPEDAETVRAIFARYVALGSIGPLAEPALFPLLSLIGRISALLKSAPS
jgi:hypothetical protein